MRKLILASQSPWRRDILARTGIPFTVEKSNYEEDLTLPLPPKKLVLEMARGKAEDVALKHPNAIVIAADTIAAFKGHVIGKPTTQKRAREVLAMLSGEWHEAMTGLVLIDTKSGKRIERTIVTKVHMRSAGTSEIDGYVKSREPLEVAGAYAIQSRAGIFVDGIKGDSTGTSSGCLLRRRWRPCASSAYRCDSDCQGVSHELQWPEQYEHQTAGPHRRGIERLYAPARSEAAAVRDHGRREHVR